MSAKAQYVGLKRCGSWSAIAAVALLPPAIQSQTAFNWQQIKAQFAAAKMGEVQLRIKAHMHRSEMDVTPGALDRMRGGEDGGTAHCNE